MEEVKKQPLLDKAWPKFQNVFIFLIAIGIIITLNHVAKVTPDLSASTVARVFNKEPTINLLILYFHISSAIPPLILGLINFSTKIRVSNPLIHRWVGIIYCACIWWSSSLGMLLASANSLGIIAQLGFGSLGFMWFFTTTMAYICARKRKFIQHRRWMIRSFSLTLAVVTVRPMFWWPPSFIEFYDWYLIVTWLCWIPNLIVAEIYARKTSINGKLNKK